MTNRIKILFWFRKSKKSTQGKGAIICRVTLNNERIEIGSTGQLCTINDWDAASQKLLSSNPYCQQANHALMRMYNDLMNVYLSYEVKQKKITPYQLKAVFKGYNKLNPTFEEVYGTFLANRIELTQGSKISYRNKCKRFIDFCKDNKMPNVEIDDINNKLMNRFYAYLLNKNYSKSYSGKAGQVIKTVLNWASEHEYISDSPIVNYATKIDRKVNTEHLTVEELNRIINFQFDANLQQVADCFIFCCQTGLEYSGIEKLDFTKSLVWQSGRLCLKDERLKTGVERFVPLTEIAIELVDKYRPINKFPVGTNQYMNRELKEIAKLCSIKKHLYWHIARKTFADHCLNEHGYSMEATMKAMGQSNLNSIKPYAKIDERRVLSEFANFQITT